LIHELNKNDFDQRVEFCDHDDKNKYRFWFIFVFFDEATFQLNGILNRHNWYWSDTNPYWMRKGNIQYSQKLNVLGRYNILNDS